MSTYKISKVITNNLVRARDYYNTEVILSGKGIGFKKTTNDLIPSDSVENVFVLRNPRESFLYDQLISTTSPKLLEISNSIIKYIQSNFEKDMNEHIHVSLSDHISFLVRRHKMGVSILNPFMKETGILYPKETAIAKQVLQMLNRELNLNIPESECSFIILHIISATSDKTLTDIQHTNQIINTLMDVLEKHLNVVLDRTTLNYARLVTHLRFMIERVERNEELSFPEEMFDLIKTNYSYCYSLAWKLSKIVQHELKKEISEAEIICISIHLYRFTENNEQEE